MEFTPGQFVRCLNKPEWGIGEVTSNQQGTKVSVFFPSLNEIKKLSLEVAKLELTGEVRPAPAARDTLSPLPKVDVERVKALCQQFIAEMKDNRRGFNDAGVAEDIIEDLTRLGRLRTPTIKRLSAWCHTDGSVFQRGVSLAQEISIALFGRVIRKES